MIIHIFIRQNFVRGVAFKNFVSWTKRTQSNLISLLCDQADPLVRHI